MFSLFVSQLKKKYEVLPEYIEAMGGTINRLKWLLPVPPFLVVGTWV